VGPTFLIFKAAVNEKGQQWVHVITRAKNSYVGYMYHKPQKKLEEKRKIRLRDIFDFPHLFQEAELTIYGQVKTVQYYCIDLLWRPINDLVCFVCVMDGDDRYILMCSDLHLPATQIITIYSYRSKIEVMFLTLKHLLGAFGYHFWTKSFPKLKRGEKLDASRLSEPERISFLRTIEAIERFINLAGIALALLQYLSLTKASEIWSNYQGWLRTYSSELPSEGVVQSVLQAEFFSSRGKVPVCRTLQVIFARRRKTPLDLAA
jgi:hypothetical protein